MGAIWMGVLHKEEGGRHTEGAYYNGRNLDGCATQEVGDGTWSVHNTMGAIWMGMLWATAQSGRMRYTKREVDGTRRVPTTMGARWKKTL